MAGETVVAPVVDTKTPAAAPAAKPDAKAPAAKPDVKAPVTKSEPVSKYKVKVEGEEVEVALEDLLASYQHSSSIGKTRRELAEEKKALEAAKDLAKKDPRKFMTLHGADLEAFQAELLREQIELAQLSDEGKELRKVKQQLTEKEQAEKDANAQAELQHVTGLVEKSINDYSTKIMKIVNDAGLSPNNPNNVRRVGHLMFVADQSGLKVEPEDIMEVVREDIIMDVQDVLKTSDDSSMLEILGEEAVTRIVKAYNKSVATRRPSTQTLPRDPNKATRSDDGNQNKHYISEAEWEARKKARRGE